MRRKLRPSPLGWFAVVFAKVRRMASAWSVVWKSNCICVISILSALISKRLGGIYWNRLKCSQRHKSGTTVSSKGRAGFSKLAGVMYFIWGLLNSQQAAMENLASHKSVRDRAVLYVRPHPLNHSKTSVCMTTLSLIGPLEYHQYERPKKKTSWKRFSKEPHQTRDQILGKPANFVYYNWIRCSRVNFASCSHVTVWLSFICVPLSLGLYLGFCFLADCLKRPEVEYCIFELHDMKWRYDEQFFIDVIWNDTVHKLAQTTVNCTKNCCTIEVQSSSL